MQQPCRQDDALRAHFSQKYPSAAPCLREASFSLSENHLVLQVTQGWHATRLEQLKAEMEKDAADLLALCEEAARAAGWKDPVKPEQITGVVSATLHRMGNVYPLTDAASLDKLEAMLSTSQYVLGGTGCPFNALLELELETGEVLPIALAIDSCGAWLSEGYYYEYGNDSQPLFDLFSVTLEELAPWT